MRGEIPDAEAMLTECSTAFSAQKAKRAPPRIKRAIPTVTSKANHNPIKRKGATTAKMKNSLQYLDTVFKYI